LWVKEFYRSFDTCRMFAYQKHFTLPAISKTVHDLILSSKNSAWLNVEAVDCRKGRTWMIAHLAATQFNESGISYIMTIIE